MPLRVEGPTRTDMKPKPWRVNPRFVGPEWRWAWGDNEFPAPLWTGGGNPRLVLPDDPADSVSRGTWAVTPRGHGIGDDGTSNQWHVRWNRTSGDRWTVGDTYTVEVMALVEGLVSTTGQDSDQSIMFYHGGWPNVPFQTYLAGTVGDAVDNAFYAETANGTDRELRISGPVPSVGDVIHGIYVVRVGVSGGTEWWVNGTLQGTGTVNAVGQEASTLGFGTRNDGGEGSLDGQIVLANLWPNDALVDGQIHQRFRDPFGPFRRQTIRYTGGPTAAGQTFTVSLAEAVVARDALDNTATLTVEVADVASAQSTETETLTMRETVSEVGVAADQLTDAQVMVEVLSEAARANDQMVGTLGRVFAAVLTESVSATDTVESRMTAVEAIAETVRAADQLNIAATLRETLSESAVAADTITAPVAGVITATLKESVSAGEALEDTMTMTAQVREAVRALDRLGLTQTLVTQVIEQAAASDQLESTLPAEALRFIFDAVRGNQDFDAVDGGTFDAQGSNDFDASGAD